MATQLQLYNIALRCIGARPLESLTEEVETRRYLDASGDLALDTCLRSGFWNFAMRGTKRDPDVTPPAFDFNFAYTKPPDWVRTRNISASQQLVPPLIRFQDQVGFWLTDVSPLYVRYVSNDANFGGALSRFPPDYAEYVGAYLGGLIFRQATGHGVDELAKYKTAVLEPAAKQARANDAMDGPAEQRPLGSWASARRSGPRVLAINNGLLHLGGG